jgi:hypothetical protein
VKYENEADEDCPCCRWMEEEFGVIDMEPMLWLNGRGVTPPDPATVTDADLHETLWRLIEELASARIFIEGTDHLSERELYEKLWNESLRESTWFAPDDPFSATHIDFSGSNGEDLDRYLRYYADERAREMWRKDFPEDEIPPHEDLPYQRDALLPVPMYPGAEEVPS